jgi:hypothetical protein
MGIARPSGAWPRRGPGPMRLARPLAAGRPAPLSLATPALLAQSVEHLHGKEGVNGSSPLEGFAATPHGWAENSGLCCTWRGALTSADPHLRASAQGCRSRVLRPAVALRVPSMVGNSHASGVRDLPDALQSFRARSGASTACRGPGRRGPRPRRASEAARLPVLCDGPCRGSPGPSRAGRGAGRACG